MNTDDADNPLTKDQEPLLTLDVWEHAYYIDYRNERPRFAEAFLKDLVNWSFVSSNYEKRAQRGGSPLIFFPTAAPRFANQPCSISSA